jgi:hypothetical protein
MKTVSKFAIYHKVIRHLRRDILKYGDRPLTISAKELDREWWILYERIYFRLDEVKSFGLKSHQFCGNTGVRLP